MQAIHESLKALEALVEERDKSIALKDETIAVLRKRLRGHVTSDFELET